MGTFEKAKKHRLEFTAYLESIGFSKEHALMEWNAHFENVGVDNLGPPIEDAKECFGYYDGQ
jgi:hypothetical protein